MSSPWVEKAVGLALQIRVEVVLLLLLAILLLPMDHFAGNKGKEGIGFLFLCLSLLLFACAAI